MLLHKLKIDDLRKLSLIDLISICKRLDNNNGDWNNITQEDYQDILEISINLLIEFQSDRII